MSTLNLDFPNFELFYNHYKNDFNKAGDPLVLFMHWYLIQSQFKILVDHKVRVNKA